MKPSHSVTSKEAVGLVSETRDELLVTIDSLQQQLLALQKAVDVLQQPPPPPPDKLAMSSPMQQSITLDDSTKSIIIADANGNKITLGPQGIALHSAQAITFSADGPVTLNAIQALNITSSQGVTVDGLQVDIASKTNATLKGAATVEVSSSGQTNIRGAMVIIN